MAGVTNACARGLRTVLALLGFMSPMLAIAPCAAQQVSLMTVDPGPQWASRFGHSAIRFEDPQAGTDVAYTFGGSDAQQGDLYLRLLQGTMEARAGSTEAAAMIEAYALEGRTIWIQRLNLRPEEREVLRQILEDARGLFPYDFFLSNCTTQLRDALDRTLGGQLREATSGRPSPRTFRGLVAPFTGSDIFLHALTTFLMADPVDRSISVWEEMFLPSTLRARLREVTVSTPSGGTAPLVQSEERIGGSGVTGTSLSTGTPVTPLPVSASAPVAKLVPARARAGAVYLGFGLLLGSALALLGAAADASPRARVVFRVLGGGWAVFTGLLGLALLALWTLTEQGLSGGNENLLQTSPLALLLASAAWGSWKSPRAARWLAAALALTAGLGALLKLHPAFDQGNLEILAIVLPGHLGLAWGVWREQSGIETAGTSYT